MRSVAEYLKNAENFEKQAAEATEPSLKKRYTDLAACYRLLAEERKRLIDAGVIAPEPPQSG